MATRNGGFDSPLDTLDWLLTAGGAAGLSTYVVGFLLGDVETATAGVGLGVACVSGTLAFRSVRRAVG